MRINEQAEFDNMLQQLQYWAHKVGYYTADNQPQGKILHANEMACEYIKALRKYFAEVK